MTSVPKFFFSLSFSSAALSSMFLFQLKTHKDSGFLFVCLFSSFYIILYFWSQETEIYVAAVFVCLFCFPLLAKENKVIQLCGAMQDRLNITWQFFTALLKPLLG